MRVGRKRVVLVGVAALLAVAGGAAYVTLFPPEPSSPVLEPDVEALPVSEPSRLCVRGLSGPCRRAEAVEATLASPDVMPTSAAPAPGGTQGSLVLALREPSGAHLLAKWRVQDVGLLQDPARELAAYEVQRLVLAPADYVVPPVAGRCFAPAVLEGATGIAEWSRLPGTSCVFGFLSYWLVDAIGMKEARRRGLLAGADPESRDPQLYQPDRFASDAVYRRNVASLNLLTFLTDNGDLHADQFVCYREPVHWFLVDSTIAFGSLHNPTLLFVQDLSELHVPSIPVSAARRLRALDEREVRALRVLAEYRIDEAGMLLPVAPSVEVIGDPEARVRQVGSRVQVGLRPSELDGLWSRIETLRSRLEDETLAAFGP